MWGYLPLLQDRSHFGVGWSLLGLLAGCGGELLWRDLAEVGGLDGVGLQKNMRVGHLVLAG